MNILEKINMNIVKWLIDIRERTRKKMILSLKALERQVKQNLVCSLLEMYGNDDKEKLDVMLYMLMRDICKYQLKDERLIEELDCYKNIKEKYKK